MYLKKNQALCSIEIITPSDPKRRGSQLSLLLHGKGKEVHDELTNRGVITDWREPNVIRVAPAPLYNRFEDCYWFGKYLEEAIQ